jgi:predicted PurR-regulated permease PerM
VTGSERGRGDTVRRAVALAGFGVGLALVARLAWPALAPFVFAGILTYLLAPLVHRLERAGVARVPGILASYALTAVVVAALVGYIVPQVVLQVTHLAHALPVLVGLTQRGWNRALSLFHEAPLPGAIRRGLVRTTANLDAVLVGQVQGFVRGLFGLVPGLLALVAAPVLAFYLLKDWEGIAARFWDVIPYPWHPAARRMLWELDAALSGYIRGQLLVALVVGVLAALLTAGLHIPFSLLIGIVAGVTDIIPFVGPIVGAAPAVILGFAHSPWTGLWAIVGFFALHQLEGNILAPKVVGDAVGLHPLLVVLVVLMGGEWAGIMGMLAAVPLAALVVVVARHVYRWLAMPPGHLPIDGDWPGSLQ